MTHTTESLTQVQAAARLLADIADDIHRIKSVLHEDEDAVSNTTIALAAGLAAAFERNVVGSALAFYALGACVIAAVSLQREGKGDDRTSDEKAHFAWQSLRLDSLGVMGAGALFKLQQMAAEGVKVPLVAFDLCAGLHDQCFSLTRKQAQS